MNLDVDECLNNPCKNGGNCNNKPGDTAAAAPQDGLVKIAMKVRHILGEENILPENLQGNGAFLFISPKHVYSFIEFFKFEVIMR